MHIYRASPYICWPCKLKEFPNVSKGYRSTALSDEASVILAYWPRKKLNTVTSVAFGIDVFADASFRDADQLAPSFVFEPKRTGTLEKRPALKASTGRSVMNVSSNMGANTKSVAGRAARSWLPARVSACELAERRHCRVPAPLSAHPLVNVLI